MEEKIIEILALHIVQIIGVLGVLFFLGFETYLILSNKKMLAKKRRCTGKTIGTVIHVEGTYQDIWYQDADGNDQHDHRLSSSYTLEYEVGGHSYTLKGTSLYTWVGEKMKVYYNPENPKDYHLGGIGLAIWVTDFAMAFFVFAIIVLIRYAVMVPVDKSDLDMEEEITYEFDLFDEIEVETEDDKQAQSNQEDTIQNGGNMTYRDTVLMQFAQADQVCIAVQPSILRKYRTYYYAPEGEEQKRLQEFMETLLSEGKPYEGKWEGMKAKGWQIAYRNKWFTVFEGGYVQSTYLDETGEVMEYFVEAPEVCSFIQNMLQEKLAYAPFQPTDIKNIVSAKLDVCSRNTNDIFYSQTITDEESLQLFEDWFSNAEYIFGSMSCENQDACLELALADGEVVCLSVATDGCANFGINGVYYEYFPASDWDSKELFERFDEIPWDWD